MQPNRRFSRDNWPSIVRRATAQLLHFCFPQINRSWRPYPFPPCRQCPRTASSAPVRRCATWCAPSRGTPRRWAPSTPGRHRCAPASASCCTLPSRCSCTGARTWCRSITTPSHRASAPASIPRRSVKAGPLAGPRPGPRSARRSPMCGAAASRRCMPTSCCRCCATAACKTSIGITVLPRCSTTTTAWQGCCWCVPRPPCKCWLNGAAMRSTCWAGRCWPAAARPPWLSPSPAARPTIRATCAAWNCCAVKRRAPPSRTPMPAWS